MKSGSLLLLVSLGFAVFQHGCSNQLSGKNQNVPISTASPTPSTQAATPQQSENPNSHGVSSEEFRSTREMLERCKHAPVAGNKAKAWPLTGTAPLRVTFDGSGAYDPDGTKIVKWKWHFGNYETGEGKIVTYTYEKPGIYGISLNVTDSQGQKTSDCSDFATDIRIIVTEPPSQNQN